MILDRINSPKDIKKLNIDELNTLASEIREAIINRVSKKGGHIGPNLGVVELTVAIHYVFDSPIDKIIFDVSHQCYTHKILAGRKDAFLNEQDFNKATGFTNPKESEHDHFIVGHTSTSISLALGAAFSRDLKKEKNNIIALIGDGSLGGGQALEALDYAGEYKNNLIIILNDNDQSIAENHGGIYKHLKELRESNGLSPNNIFKNLGLDYIYLDSGNSIKDIINVLKKAKDIDHPIVIHIHTIKGKGLPYAEIYKEEYHSGGPFNISTGKYNNSLNKDKTVLNSLISFLDKYDDSVIINAGTPNSTDFDKSLRAKYKNRYIDVGICEENALSLTSSIAKFGSRAVFATFAPFYQRTYDQISHDMCLNNSPATLLIYSSGVFGLNSNTHLALCDVQMFSHIPNFVYVAPATRSEYLNLFNYGVNQKDHPIGIKIPPKFIDDYDEDKTDFSNINKNKVIYKGKKVAIIAIGMLLSFAFILKEKYKDLTIINPLFLSGVDIDLLESLKKDHELIITLEDGEKDGGYGERIASFYGDSNMKVLNFGISKFFHSDFEPYEKLKENGISIENLSNILDKYY